MKIIQWWRNWCSRNKSEKTGIVNSGDDSNMAMQLMQNQVLMNNILPDISHHSSSHTHVDCGSTSSVDCSSFHHHF